MASCRFISTLEGRLYLLFALIILMLRNTVQSNPQDSRTSERPSNITVAESNANDESHQDIAAIVILSQNCFRCHGSVKQEGGLRLNHAKSASIGGDSGVAIIPGNAAASPLIRRVCDEGDVVMPPSGERLTKEQIRILSGWIDRGAKWPENSIEVGKSEGEPESGIPWAFRPVIRPELPIVNRKDWIINEIDLFVLSRLEMEGLSPSPEAERQTLIRRLSFDLRGLPPSNEEVEAFLTDSSNDAYERLVDRYLASPQFGERWSRHWLDRTHYAESSGCLVDLSRPYAWRWRDWVVDSINDDLGFDQFTKHQIAGDILPDANSETRVATGFFKNALANFEPGIDLDSERAKTVVDRTSTVGAAWLGITLACAECHSHKFDPISQRDFYRMYAFFDRINDHCIDAPSAAMSASFAEETVKYQHARSAYLRSKAEGQSEWEAQVKMFPDIWHIPREFDVRSFRSIRFAMVHPQADGSFAVDGVRRGSDRHQLQFVLDQKAIRAIRVELLADPTRFNAGPGRGSNGHCQMTGMAIHSAPVDRPADGLKSTFSHVLTDYCSPNHDASQVLTETDNRGWLLDQSGVSHAAIFVLDSRIDCKVPTNIHLLLKFNSGEGRTPSRFRIAVTDKIDELVEQQAIPGDIRHLLSRDASSLSDDERALINQYFQSTYTPGSIELADWNNARQKYTEYLQPRGAECVQESWQTRETRIHLRGDFSRLGDIVQPGIPSFFETDDEKHVPWTRIELSDWMVSPKNPLSPRVAINSFWQPLFGVGLVRTPGDFGNQGDPPSHPELLDWLADQFIEDGWSRKRAIRRIVCSATYRQSSKVSEEAIHHDPENVRLGRQKRFRLEAEIIRDCILDRAGLLNLRMGGPSYRLPHLEENEVENWEPLEIPPTIGDKFRRGLYIAVRRNVPEPFLTTFDAPDGASVCPMRHSTNTPLQAFSLMNDPIFVEAARSLSTSDLVSRNAAPSENIKRLWVHCIGRQPMHQELKLLEELFSNLAAIENARVDQINPEQASRIWFVIARTILNLDESITRE